MVPIRLASNVQSAAISSALICALIRQRFLYFIGLKLGLVRRVARSCILYKHSVPLLSLRKVARISVASQSDVHSARKGCVV